MIHEQVVNIKVSAYVYAFENRTCKKLEIQETIQAVSIQGFSRAHLT